MNIHLGQSIHARNELKRIANVQYQIVGVKESSPIIGCQQDTLSGAYILTEPSTKLKGWEVANILCNTSSDTKMDIEMDKEYTGHQVFSHIIPEGINNTKKSGDKITFQIENGKLTTGYLDKSSLSFAKNSIIHFIWDKYGPSKTRRFIDDSQKLVLNYLLQRGQTVGFKDTVIDDKMEEQVQKIIAQKILESKYAITQYENETEQLSLDTIENSLVSDLGAVQANIGQILMAHLKIDNFFWTAAKSGAKGSAVNVAQISGVLGQNNVEGSRFKKKVEGRSLIYWHKDDDTPEARGFIKNSFLSGLRGYEFFYNAAAGREGLIDTAIKSVTWETPIIIIEDKKPIYIEIGKWIDYKLEMNKEKVQLMKEQNMEIMDILNDVYIPTTDYNGNVSWGQITAITRHDPGNQLYEIKTKSGRSVTVTESKSLLIWDSDKKQFNEKLTPEIKIGDFVPVTSNLIQSNVQINYIDECRIYQLVFDSDFPEKFLLDNKNGVFIGIMLSNNTSYSLQDNTVKISYINKNISSFIETWLRSYSIKHEITNNKEIIVYSELLVKFLAIQLGKSEKHIPTKSFIAPDTFVRGILNGYLSCDGYICENSINLYSSNKRLIEGINMLYSRLGIFGEVSETENNKPIYELSLRGNWAKLLSTKLTLINQIENTKLKQIYWSDETDYKIVNDVVLDPIVEINLISPKLHPKMYDLTIPNTFNFGLANGLQVRDTASTGYIQRQLIKGLEDLSIRYDGTNRNARGIIVQTIYGENGINQSTQTELQLNILAMDNKTLSETLGFSAEQLTRLEKELKISKKDLNEFNNKHINKLKELRDEMRKIQSKALINYKILEEKFMLPVNFFRITQDYSNKKELKVLDNELTPEYIEKRIEDFLVNYDNRLITSLKPSDKFMKNDDRNMKFLLEVAINEYLAPVKCIFDYGLNKKKFDEMMKEINMSFIKSIIEPGEMVGIIAAQSVGEPTSQMTLNTKHFAGVSKGGSANIGVPRIQELLHYSKNIKTPIMTIYFKEEYSTDRSALNKVISYFKHLSIRQLLSSAEVYYDVGNNDLLNKKIKGDNVSGPFFVNNQKADINSLPFVFRIKFDIEKMLEKETTLLDIKTKFISHWYKNYTNLKNLSKNEKEVISRISRCAILSNLATDKEQIIHVRFSMSSFNYNIITDFLKMIFDDITLKGIENIENVDISQERIIKYNKETGEVKPEKEYVAFTSGINFDKIRMIKGIDMTRTKCNDVATTLRLYGIEATRQILLHELSETYKAGGSNINLNHLSLLIDQMCHLGEITSMDRHGLSKIDIDPIARASFEKTMDHFVNAALFNEKDTMKSVSSRIAIGRVIPGGTGAFDLLLDTKKLESSEYTEDETGGRITFAPLEEEPLLLDIMKYSVGKADFYIPN